MGKPTDVVMVLFPSALTEWDEADRIVGGCDLPASPRAFEGMDDRLKALAAAAPGGLECVSAVLCSPDEASQDTGERVAAAAGGRVRVVEGLGEVRLGLWEGLLRKDAEDKFPKVYAQWRDNPASVHVPEGESLFGAADRALQALAKALDKTKLDDGECVAVVVRPLLAGVLRCWARGTDLGELWSVLDEGVEGIRLTRAQLKRMREGMRAKA